MRSVYEPLRDSLLQVLLIEDSGTVNEVPWCITLDNSKGISRLRFWAKNSRVNGINDLPVFMHQGNAHRQREYGEHERQ